ncbi:MULTISPECIES: carbohydrate ABC transporter permease [Paenibacillus]|uniref:Carbohydrate ABC transporter permease n=1 Tax=Paenibacillus radicis (ex Xue et al. 2023) TaxID=2972489 RepID=A0ABT1YGB9_9BACL|nr:carbohydrate ABC transporter permease [Paenibacillus radicis (ex Xue et al. 2023)]MCR8632243.1 carbohydrate ABC transporter permease [Paenibacillus radicis (ex Xue et al. 2023)]
MRQRNRIASFASLLVLTVGAVIMIIPFLWMISTAFKTSPELNVWPPTFIPNQFNFSNFAAVFKAAPFHLYFLNSLKMATFSAAAIVFTSMLAGYIFAKFRYFGLAFLFSIFLSTAIVPFEIYMIPLYLQMQQLDLLNKFTGMVMPYLVMSFGIFFMRQNIIQQIPDEIIESARVEGASEWRIFFQIVFPLMTAPISALSIFAFIEAWNSFVWPLLVVGDKSLFTMELGLAMFQSTFSIDMTVMSAGSVISIIPIMIVFIFLRKYIIQSVSMTGSK